jgi:nickel transport protein
MLVFNFLGGVAQAHNVTVFAWVEGDTVHVESKFSGGRKPVQSPVEVYDSQGNLLLKGLTDDNGEFSFKVPKKTEMKIVLLAGMGHRAEWKVPLKDLEDVPTEKATPATAQKSAAVSPETTGSTRDTASVPDQSLAPTSAEYLSAGELQSVLDATLDRKLKPVMKLLAETRQTGPSVTDVMGGIGYIFGLVGVVAYFRARRSKT